MFENRLLRRIFGLKKEKKHEDGKYYKRRASKLAPSIKYH
jgi:hypothetical protein